MGKGNWFNAVKKIFGKTPNPDEKQAKIKSKKKRWFGKSKSIPGPGPFDESERASAVTTTPLVLQPVPPPPVQVEPKEVKSVGVSGEQDNHAYSVALASAVAAEAAAVAAKAAAEVVRLTAATASARAVPAAARSKEEIAAVKIQTAFRGYLARRALRALRGLVRLKLLVDGNTVKRQTKRTLHSMQTMAMVQLQIHSRRVRMEEEKQAMLKQLQHKHEQELEKSKIEEDWDHRHLSKEQIEEKLLMKQEAAIRRERALAYAFSHQWRKASSKAAAAPAFIEPGSTNWGWSWMDRWLAANPQSSKARAPSSKAPSVAGKSSRPSSRQSLVTPQFKPFLPAGKNSRPTSSKSNWTRRDEDSRSIGSVRSERPQRRQSIGGASDVISLTSTPPLPSYMQLTESARARARQDPVAVKFEDAVRAPVSLARKRLSFPVDTRAAGSTVTGTVTTGRVRRHSDVSNLELSALKDVSVQ